jgi:hypothetical protein
MAVLADLATFLQTQGLGTPASTILAGTIPEDVAGAPDEVMYLLETPGLAPEHVHDIIGPAVEQPVIQIRIRGRPYGYEAARAKAQQAFVALDSLVNTTLSGTAYRQVMALQSPFLLQVDDWHRPHIVFHVRCQKAV